MRKFVLSGMVRLSHLVYWPIVATVVISFGFIRTADAQENETTGATRFFEASVSSDTQFVSWHSSNGAKGHQLYNPVTLTASARDGLFQTDVSVRSGYHDTYQLQDNTFFVPGFGTFGSYNIGDLSGATDTVAQLRVQYLGMSSVVPYFTFGVNIPTGHNKLEYRASDSGPKIYGDPYAVGQGDVVFLSHFGEGLNIMVGGGASIRLQPGLILSAGGTYNFRNDYSSALATDIGGLLRYSPGGQLSLNAGLSYSLSRWSFASNLAYRTEQTSNSVGTYIGPGSFKLGDAISIDGSISYAWSDQHVTALFGAFTHVSNNYHVDDFFGLPVDFDTKNSDVYELALSHNYHILPWLSVFGRGSWRERPLESVVPPNSLVPRTRWAGEGGLEVRANQKVTAKVSIGRLHVVDEATSFSERVETDGWFGSLSTTVRW